MLKKGFHKIQNWKKCFTYIETIGGWLYSKHTKNIKHVHKYGKYLFPVVVILVTNSSGRYKVFYKGVMYSDLCKIVHSLNNLCYRCVVGPFEIWSHEGTLWWGHIVLISFILHKSTFLHLFYHGDIFYNIYIKSDTRTKYICDYGMGMK